MTKRTKASRLIAAQLGRLLDNQASRTAACEAEITRLNECQKDHEDRLRVVTEGVSTWKFYISMAGGGSILVSLGALVKAFLAR